MATIRVSIIDVIVLRPAATGWEALVLRRAAGKRSPGSWETVHGRMDAGELPAAAALRELREETGLTPERFYNLSRVESFYLHRTDELEMIPAFCALVLAGAACTVSAEHDGSEWLAPDAAAVRLHWPRDVRALADALKLLEQGTAGPLDDVLRVR